MDSNFNHSEYEEIKQGERRDYQMQDSDSSEDKKSEES